MKTKIVFFGTPEVVLPVLTALNKVYEVVAVVTRAPAKTGRDQKLTYSAVDTWAHKHGVAIYHSSHNLLADKSSASPFAHNRDNISAQFAVLAAYGAILPAEVIGQFPKGILNIHPSLLPSWRGASPVQATLAAGESQAGVSVIRLDDHMDHGPLLGQFREDISPTETAEELTARLFDRAADYLIGLLPAYLSGKLKPRPQDDSQATHTKLLKKEHGFVPWEALQAAMVGKSSGKWEIPFMTDYTTTYSPETIYNVIRALTPWPGVWTQISLGGKEKRLKILEARLAERKLILEQVQLESKNSITWSQFKELI